MLMVVPISLLAQPYVVGGVCGDDDGRSHERAAGQAEIETDELEVPRWHVPRLSVAGFVEGYEQGVEAKALPWWDKSRAPHVVKNRIGSDRGRGLLSVAGAPSLRSHHTCSSVKRDW